VSPLGATGALLGIAAGCGAVLVVLAVRGPRVGRRRRAGALTQLLKDAGVPRLSVSGLIAVSVMVALIAGMVALVATALPVASLLAAGVAACVPAAVLRRRVSARRRALLAAWPDAIDALVSAVRAGMALPEALGDLGRSGPLPLRPAFASFGAEYRATGSFDGALALLQDRLADPVADRVLAAFGMARAFGGTDLTSVLRTLSAMVRDGARLRGEIAGRQSWTVAAARLAVAAPWVTLVLLCTRTEAARAYATTAGAVVLAVAAVLSAVAYAVMTRIGRLPADERMIP
jgi:tight adherence protein B